MIISNNCAVSPAKSLKKPNITTTFTAKPESADHLVLSSKINKSKEVLFQGLWDKMFPLKADKDALNKFVSIMNVDPIFKGNKDPIEVTYDTCISKFNSVSVLKKDDKVIFESGYASSGRNMIVCVKGEIDIKSREITYKILDGVEHEKSDIKYSVNAVLRDVVRIYKAGGFDSLRK